MALRRVYVNEPLLAGCPIQQGWKHAGPGRGQDTPSRKYLAPDLRRRADLPGRFSQVIQNSRHSTLLMGNARELQPHLDAA